MTKNWRFNNAQVNMQKWADLDEAAGLTRQASFSYTRPGNAVAIEYDPKAMNSPLVGNVASGDEALMLLRLARRYGVPISRDITLTHELALVPERGSIPQKTFLRVAQLLKDLGTCRSQ